MTKPDKYGRLGRMGSALGRPPLAEEERVRRRNNQRETDRRYKKLRIQRNRLRIQELKRSPCSDCGGAYHPKIMHFDHARGTKLQNLSSATALLWGWRKIEEEIAKCDLVCPTCHAIRTMDRAGRL